MPTGLSLLRANAAALLMLSMLAPSAQAASASVHYTYDALGRVRTALYDNGTCIAYAYDAVGNRTAQVNTQAGTPETPTWGTGSWGCFQWTAEGGAWLRRGDPSERSFASASVPGVIASQSVGDGARPDHLRRIDLPADLGARR